MERRNFLGAIAALALGCNEKIVGPALRPPKPTPIPNVPEFAEVRTWELGERAYLNRFGWSVCVLKGTDETAMWRRCDPPAGIYNLRNA